MHDKLNNLITIFALIVMVTLMILTRGHNNWFSSIIHLPDFTIPALFIAGVYFRQFWVVFVLIVSAIAIDNVAIVYQGISANCITPAYSFLPLTYYGVFWASKYLTTLKIDGNMVKNTLIIVMVSTLQWFAATVSYYAFTTSPWVKFPSYITHWSMLEIPILLYWMIAVMIVFTLVPYIIPSLNIQKNAG